MKNATNYKSVKSNIMYPPIDIKSDTNSTRFEVFVSTE